MLTLISIYLINQREKIGDQFKYIIMIIRRPVSSDS